VNTSPKDTAVRKSLHQKATTETTFAAKYKKGKQLGKGGYAIGIKN
jgi:hypothetical protein